MKTLRRGIPIFVTGLSLLVGVAQASPTQIGDKSENSHEDREASEPHRKPLHLLPKAVTTPADELIAKARESFGEDFAGISVSPSGKLVVHKRGVVPSSSAGLEGVVVQSARYSLKELQL